MGGQIMPPVMGAVAFIMAENLNVPYAEIVKAAAIPAILYYVTAFWMVHLEAGRKNLTGMPKDECPNPWHAMRDNWYLLLPLVVLVVDPVQRLHADVRRHGRPGADRRADPRRRHRRAGFQHGLPLRVLGGARGSPPQCSSRTWKPGASSRCWR
jgi:hypothetical protein